MKVYVVTVQRQLGGKLVDTEVFYHIDQARLFASNRDEAIKNGRKLYHVEVQEFELKEGDEA